MSALLLLEDGRAFAGRPAGAPGTSFGEVVFNTAMAGYQETLTDPSYGGQIVVMTASHVGNYGVNAADAESGRLQVAGFVTRHLPERPSSARAEGSLRDALRGAGIVAVDGVDTRALVRHLRSQGAMRGAVASDVPDDAARDRLLDEIRRQPLMEGAALALEAGTRTPRRFTPGAAAGSPRVAALDLGIKKSILDRLASRGLDVWVFPASTAADELRGFDGYFLSNGPGDPAALPGPIATAAALVETGRPVFGICLGHQLLARALGASTFKLPFGHRGVNHPVKSLESGAVTITSQNHGFSVDPATLPPGAVVTHTNLNDGTCEGFRLEGRPVFAVQYHPESSPGPHDSDALFDEFVQSVRARGR